VTPASRLDAATFEVAGVTCRVECVYAKPILWVTELHPGFRSTRDPDVVVTFRYEDGYWARDLPWIASDRLVDAPRFEEHPGASRLRSAYYDAEIDADRRRVRVRVASGFGVGNVLRALYAILLPRHGACLARASLQPVDDAAVLVCDDASDGVVALVDRGRDRGVDVEPTPFHQGTTPVRERARRVVDVVPASRRVDVAAKLLARVVTFDHSVETLERVLDVVTRLVAGLPVVTDAGAAGARR
jgi:hypothetical protein